MKKLLLVLFLVPIFCIAQDNAGLAGDFKGTLVLPSTKLQVVLHFTEDDRKLSGTMDIPEQNAKGLKLDNVKYTRGDVSFTVPDVPGTASFTGKWNSANDSLCGTFVQNGITLPLRTKRIVEEAGAKPKLSLAAKVLKIERYCDSLIKKGDIAGMSVGILYNGEIILNKGFGYRDYENKIKCDHNTLFAIGSCTKAFTSCVLAQLNDEGSFNWEKPVKEYVPYFGMKDKFADEQINGIDICTHRSGLPRHDLVWYGSALSRHELIERIQYMEPNKAFRTTWQYNNFMFLTAGVVAEEITKDTWENQVQKRIFDPLGMKNSKNHFTDFIATENRSIGYDVEEKKIIKKEYRNIDPMGPAGSIFSSSTDMLEWVRLMLNKGKVKDQQLVSAEQIKFLLSPKIVMENPGTTFKQMSYAMGWMIGEYQGKTYIEHGGNIDGFTANVAMVPEENLGIVVLSNKDGTGIPEILGLYITDMMLGNDEYDWYEEKIGKNRRAREAAEAEAKKKEEEEKKKTKPVKPEPKKGPSHDLKMYAGEYSDNAYGKIVITYENNELVAKYNTLSLKLKHDKFETFIATLLDEEMKMTFFTNASGKVEWFQIQLEATVPATKFVRGVPNYLNDASYMTKIVGQYDFVGAIMTLKMDKNRLISSLTDGQEFELVPSGENMFKIKEIEGYNMEFIFDEKGNCIKAISHQPNGDYDAKKIVK